MPARHGARERAALVPEQLALEQGLGQRSTVDGHERAPCARALLVNRARHELLARAALTQDEHGRVGRRHVRYRIVHLAHRARIADEAAEALGSVQALLQIMISCEQPMVLDRTPQHRRECIARVDRLDQVVISSGANGRHRRLYVGVSGEYDHADLRPALAHVHQEVHPRHAGHVQVGQHALDLARVLIEQSQRLGPGFCTQRLKALRVQRSAQHAERQWVVVDQQ